MHRRLLVAAAGAAAALTMLLGSGSALAASDTWVQWAVSPPAALSSWMRSFDFTAAGTVLASSDGGGAFQAATGAGPWTQTNSGLDTPGDLTAYQVVASGSKLYAATSSGLFTATAGPSPSWTQLGGGIGENKLNMGGIQTVAVEPGSLVVGVAGAADPGVYTSSDGGGTWTRAAGMPPVEHIWWLAPGPGPVIYAAGESGVWTSVDGGASWTLTSDGIDTSGPTLRVAVTPGSPNVLWASSSSDVYESVNGGVSWVNADGTGSTLPAAQAKYAFLLPPQVSGKFGSGRAVVGTADGVWATIDGGGNWAQMSTDGSAFGGGYTNFGDEIIWALGFAPTGANLLAGTQKDGVFALPLTPVSAPASETLSETSGVTPGDVLTVSGDWLGTAPFFYTYQWKRCQGSSCTTVSDSAEYTVPDSDAATPTTYYKVTVCADNLVSPAYVCKTSNSTSPGVAPVPGTAPVPLSGGNSSSISPDPQVSYPWGTTFTIDPGDWGTEANPGTQIQPSYVGYQWERCDQSDTCTVIPGATAQTYTATPDDVGSSIRGYVRVINGFFPGVPGDFYEAGETFTIIEKTPVNTALPKIVGVPYVGQTLQSTAGAWSGHDPAYTRDWLECAPDGLDCQPLNPDQTGKSYTLTAADIGSVLELQVTATQYDPSQNRVAQAVSKPTAVISYAPGNNPPPPPKPPAIRISGPHKLKVGSKLHGPATVAGYVKLSYEWLRNGKPINHATNATYKVSRSDLGKRLSLRITLTRSGGGTTIVTSNSVKVPKPKPKPRRKRHKHKHRR